MSEVFKYSNYMLYMVTRRTVTYSKRFSILSFIQQLIAVGIGVLFFLGLIPFSYADIGGLLVGLIVIQALISLLRLEFLSFLYELFLLLLAVLSFIPVLGYVFRFIGFLGAFIDVLIHGNSKMVRKVQVVSMKSPRRKKKSKSVTGKVYDAEYKEKK